MPFGAGRGSPQIVGAGGEEGKQAPGEAGQVQLLRLLEEVGRQGHEELTLQDGDEGGDSGVVGAQDGVELEDMVVDGVEDGVVDGVVDGVEDMVEDVIVGGDIARQGEAEEDSDEGSEMEGDGKQVEEVVGSDGELGMVQVLEELTAQEEVGNAEVGRDLEEEQDGRRGMERDEAGKLDQEVQQPVGGREQVMGSLVGCKLVGKVGLVGRGGVDWGLVVVVVVLA